MKNVKKSGCSKLLCEVAAIAPQVKLTDALGLYWMAFHFVLLY